MRKPGGAMRRMEEGERLVGGEMDAVRAGGEGDVGAGVDQEFAGAGDLQRFEGEMVEGARGERFGADLDHRNAG